MFMAKIKITQINLFYIEFTFNVFRHVPNCGNRVIIIKYILI